MSVAYAVKGVRILLVGDDGVGKTSLILSLVTEEFPDDVPSRAEEITIPADVTPEKVPTHIVDFSYAEQSEDELRDELEHADVICVVYGCDSDESIERITTFWLPIVFEVCGNNQKPVVLVGNKSDLMEEEGEKTDRLLAIMGEYPQVETCIECSAYELKNISELFYYAQKAVLHPTAPLFSHDEQQLTEKCQIGLMRIFKICDQDNDGILNDIELNEFQKRCFQNSLLDHGLKEVKNIIKRNMEDGVTEEGVTLPGFLFLHSLFIQKGRQETTWTALRRFGYSHNLELRDDYLVPSLEKGSDCSVELSEIGIDFVLELFDRYAKEHEECITPDELNDMLSICEENPWADTDFTATVSSEEGWMTGEGFVAQWILWTYIDYTWALKHFAQLGFINSDLDDQLPALKINRSKSIDYQKKKTARKVFLVYVVGSPGVGKSSFLQSFIKKRYDGSTVYSEYTINEVTVPTQNRTVHLILKEIPFHEAKEQLMESRHDATIYLYDVSDPKSFGPIAELHNEVNLEKIPSIFIGTKKDRTSVRQECTIQPNEFAVIHSLYPLQYYTSLSDKESKLRSVFNKIATLCTHVGHNSVSDSSLSKIALSYGLGLSIVLGVGFIVFRFIRQSHNVVSNS